jgi:hypothetical protein
MTDVEHRVSWVWVVDPFSASAAAWFNMEPTIGDGTRDVTRDPEPGEPATGPPVCFRVGGFMSETEYSAQMAATQPLTDQQVTADVHEFPLYLFYRIVPRISG